MRPLVGAKVSRGARVLAATATEKQPQQTECHQSERRGLGKKNAGLTEKVLIYYRVFAQGAVADDALSIGGRAFAIFFLEGAKLDGIDFGKAGEDFIAVGRGTGGIRQGFNMSR